MSNSATILLVEDEFLIRLTLSEVLMDEGYTVLEAENGADAVKVLQSNPGIDLLLTDIQLPGGMDGNKVAQAARQARPNLPVIFMTGAPDTAEAAAPGSRTTYLSKPYLPGDMCAAVRKMLEP